MTKKNLSRELIVNTAFEMIDAKGTDAFSVRQLADRLGVQVSSLYNHIKNENDILLSVAKASADMYSSIVSSKIDGLSIEEAVHVGGDAFRDFMKEHKYLYELLLDSRWIGDPEFAKLTESFTKPIEALTLDDIENKEALEHIYVAMRTVTHGFSSLDTMGIFDDLSVDPSESYHMLIDYVFTMMKDLRKKD